jgi:hypothetical protein
MIISLFLLLVLEFFWIHIVTDIIIELMYTKYHKETWWGFPVAFVLSMLPVVIGVQVIWEYIK